MIVFAMSEKQLSGPGSGDVIPARKEIRRMILEDPNSAARLIDIVVKERNLRLRRNSMGEISNSLLDACATERRRAGKECDDGGFNGKRDTDVAMMRKALNDVAKKPDGEAYVRLTNMARGFCDYLVDLARKNNGKGNGK